MKVKKFSEVDLDKDYTVKKGGMVMQVDLAAELLNKIVRQAYPEAVPIVYSLKIKPPKKKKLTS